MHIHNAAASTHKTLIVTTEAIEKHVTAGTMPSQAVRNYFHCIVHSSPTVPCGTYVSC